MRLGRFLFSFYFGLSFLLLFNLLVKAVLIKFYPKKSKLFYFGIPSWRLKNRQSLLIIKRFYFILKIVDIFSVFEIFENKMKKKVEIESDSGDDSAPEAVSFDTARHETNEQSQKINEQVFKYF